jgi:DNA polymerase-3 subunit delta'
MPVTTWNDIQGQDHAVGWLRRAWKADRMPHGLIFAGPGGVGKGMAANALATLFLCERPDGELPCAVCPACRALAAASHPDLHLIYRQLVRLEHEDRKASELSINLIRDYLIEPASRKAGLNRGKVFIVEEAELMNAAAQNALLKVLEEPAGRTLIILLTDQPDALLPTVRSRCQIVRFVPLPAELVQSQLTRRGISSADAADAAALSGGSPGLAIAWLQDGVVTGARELRERLERLISGKPVEDLPEWFRAATDALVTLRMERDKLASKEQTTRGAVLTYLTIAGRFLSQWMAASEDSALLERLCAAAEAIGRAAAMLESNVNVSLIFQELAVTLEELAASAAGQR